MTRQKTNKEIMMISPIKTINLLILLFVFFISGCAYEDIYNNPVSYGKPTQVKDGLVLQERSSQDFTLLKVTSTGITSKKLFSFEEGENNYQYFTDDSNEKSSRLFALTNPENSRDTELEFALNVIDISTGDFTRYKIGSQFKKHTFDKSNVNMILYHDGLSTNTESIYNPNEIAILNTTENPSGTNPMIMSLNTKGRIIQDVQYIGKTKVGKTERDLFAFITDNMIMLMDLNDKNHNVVNINLTQSSDNRTVVASQLKMIGAQGNFGPQIFIRANGAAELFDIELSDDSTSSAGYSTNLYLYDTGSTTNSFEVVNDNGELILVAVSSALSTITLFEVDSAASFTISAERGLTKTNPRKQNNSDELLLYGDGTSSLYFLAVDNLLANKGENLLKLTIPTGVNTPELIDDDRMAVFSYYSNTMTLVDFNTREMSNIGIDSKYDYSDSILWEDTYFVNGGSELSYLNLATGHPQSMVTDEPVTELYIFDSQKTGVAMHNAATGRATMFPLDSPKRSDAFIEDGFLVSGILNREEN
ncbi:MAG: hypothetical protein JXR91_16265 [Deltaproteobacteria bacterium]|nr:hypothetical protein [Deltaproteobacteria bacterium]